MDIEQRLLRSFVAVAEELHFGRAAERLHLSQPALSRQMAELERRLDAKLLTRGTRSVALTEAGALLRREAPRLLSDLSRVVSRVQGAARGELGHIAIGFLGSAIQTFVTPALKSMRLRAPGLTYTLTERLWIEQTSGLADGSDDVAFVRDLRDSTWRHTALLTEPVCLVLYPDHPLADRAIIQVAELPLIADELFLTDRLPTGQGVLPSWLAWHCGGWPFMPKVSDELKSTQGILALVQARVGISVMPASYASWGSDDIRFIPIEKHETVLQVAWNIERTPPATGLFLEVLNGLAEAIGAAPQDSQSSSSVASALPIP